MATYGLVEDREKQEPTTYGVLPKSDVDKLLNKKAYDKELFKVIDDHYGADGSQSEMGVIQKYPDGSSRIINDKSILTALLTPEFSIFYINSFKFL